MAQDNPDVEASTFGDVAGEDETTFAEAVGAAATADEDGDETGPNAVADHLERVRDLLADED